MVPFFPLSAGILGILSAQIQGTALLLSSVSNSFPLPPDTKHFGHIQFQVRAFVLGAKFILAPVQLCAGGGGTELSLWAGRVVGATWAIPHTTPLGGFEEPCPCSTQGFYGPHFGIRSAGPKIQWDFYQSANFCDPNVS